ncbi:MAG TPA: endonuclease III [Planctomycetaceae bacterium]|jgi:endonuclease-3|nr:endonuclease III [Planctomycetaceae bacterium]
MVRTQSVGGEAALKKRAAAITRALARAYPDAVCALQHENPFQLLVATILSAQCTDERVNLVTPELFRQFPTPEKLSQASQSDVERIIKSTGFFRAKARNLRAMAQKVTTDFGSELPRSVEELTQLPGVGRKTANVLLGTAFGISTGVVVDTHVKRIVHLLGLTRHTLPEKVERDLMSIVPRKEWVNFSHRLIHHGRRICIARRPKCFECPLLKLCPRIGLSPLSPQGPRDARTP